MKQLSNLKKNILFLFALFVGAHAAIAATYSISKDRFISYTDNGQGQALVLIHAFPTDKNLWQPQQKALQKKFRVITIDLWGFGQSSPVNGKTITMTEYADEVKLLLDQLNVHQAIIGGESMGGYITLAFLKKYPEMVNGLILSDTQSIADSPESKLKREATVTDILKNGSAQLISSFMSKALSQYAQEKTVIFLKNIVESQSASAEASALRGMSSRKDLSDVLRHTQLPVLIITGKQDTLILPEQSQAMHQLAVNSQLVIIDHAAHLSNLEQPKKWNQAVIDMFTTKPVLLSEETHE